MKKIHQKTIGLPPIIDFDKAIVKIEKYDWYGNAAKPINQNEIPGQIETIEHNESSQTITVNIFKDTSDNNVDENGIAKEINAFFVSPKKIYLNRFNHEFKRIKTEITTKGEHESTNRYHYDEDGNMRLNEYKRLGYIQHKNEYQFDQENNLIQIINYKDVSHGNEVFEPESKSIFEYKPGELSFKRTDYKYKESKFIERGLSEYIIELDSNGAFTVDTNMLHIRTGNQTKTKRKYDLHLNQIANYAYQGEAFHPHSINYHYEYDSKNNWIKRIRERTDGTITLLTKRIIKYKES